MDKSKKKLVVAGLFLFAFLYLGLLWLLAPAGGSRVQANADAASASANGPEGTAAPASPAQAMRSVNEDGSIKAQVTSLDRDKFHVTLSLNVTDKDGRELSDLRGEEILVYEDGVPVATKKFEPAGQGGVRVGLLVDFGGYTGIGTGGVSQGQREMVMVSLPSILKALHDRTDHFGLWVNNAYALQKNYREVAAMGPVDQVRRDAALGKLDDLLDFRGAELFATIGLALSKMAEVRGKRTLVILTDGWDDITFQKQRAPTKTIQEQKQAEEDKILNDLVLNARKYNIPIYMIQPAGGRANEAVLKKLASETGGEHYIAAGSAKLTDYLIQNVFEKLRKDYTVEYDSPNPVEDGLTRKVEVVVRSGASGAKTESEYLMPGVVAVGGSRPAPPTGGSAASRSDGSGGGAATGPPIIKIFLPLALAIAALFALPYLLWLIPRGKTEPAEAPPTPTPPPAPPRPQAAAARSAAAPKPKVPHSPQSGPPPKVW